MVKVHLTKVLDYDKDPRGEVEISQPRGRGSLIYVRVMEGRDGLAGIWLTRGMARAIGKRLLALAETAATRAPSPTPPPEAAP